MVAKKTAVITLRVDPEIKRRFQWAADHEHRNISNFVEFVLTKYCDEKGYIPPEQQSLDIVDIGGKSDIGGD